MSKPHLNVFRPQLESSSHERDEAARIDSTEHELARISGTAEPKTVSLPLGKLVPLLLDAVSGGRAWLNDFHDDPVRIDADLYDVLLAYQQLRERSA